MSTKTTFKRVALVAVAALGLGVLSVAPSSAAVNTDSLVLKNTLGTTTSTFSVKNGETVTAQTSALAIYTFLPATAATDSVSVTASLVSAPAGNTALPYMSVSDTTSATVNDLSYGANNTIAPNAAAVIKGAANSTVSVAKLNVYLGTSKTAGATVAGDYVVKLTVKNMDGSTPNATSQTLTITVGAVAVAADSTSTAWIADGYTTTPTADTDLLAVYTTKTVSTHSKANILVTEANAAGTANESFTATITGPGTLGSGAALDAASSGRSITVKNGHYVSVWADGTAGTATITLTGVTSGVVFGTKSVTFTGTAIAKVTATAVNSVIGVAGTSKTSAIKVVAYDADGRQVYNPSLYVTSDNAAVITSTYASCTWDGAVYIASFCTLAPVAKGTANIKITTASSVAATYQGDGVTTTQVTSDAVAIRVGSTTPAKVTLSFDKASYYPGEKATLTVALFDADGKAVAGSADNSTYAAAFAAGGITSDYAFYTGSDTLTSTFVQIKPSTGVKAYTVYMPLQATTVTVSATADTLFPAAYQATVVTASATVGNSAGVDAATDAANEATDAANAATDAALAAADAADAATAAAQDASDAVAALSATVAKLVASLKAQLTSLTNLVIKIQKKVRA